MKRQRLEAGVREAREEAEWRTLEAQDAAVQAEAEPGTSTAGIDGASEADDVNGEWALIPTDDGSYYYYNSTTGQSQWEVPFSTPPLPPPPIFPVSESPAGTSAVHAATGTSAASGADGTGGFEHGTSAGGAGFAEVNSYLRSRNPRKRATPTPPHADYPTDSRAASSSSTETEVSDWQGYSFVI